MNFANALSVAVITKPVKLNGESAATDIMEAVMKALNGHMLPSKYHSNQKIRVLSWQLVPNATYLIYEVKAEIQTIL